MTDATALPLSKPKLIDWACLNACWRLGRQPFRFGGVDSAFTFLGAMMLVIGASAAIPVVAPQFRFELSLGVMLACLLPAVVRRARALGPALAIFALGTALAIGAAAVTLRAGALPDWPLPWQIASVAVSREMQGGLLVLALAPARRQAGARRQVRLVLLLAVGALAGGAAAAGLLRG